MDEKSKGEDKGEEEEEDKEEELEKKTALPVAKVLKKLGSPLRSLGKRKASQRSPELVQDKGACDQQPFPIPSVNIPELLMGSSSSNSLAMPPLSSIYSVVNCQDPFYVQRLEHQLWESQEDLKNVICHSELRESILYEDIAHFWSAWRG